MTSSKPLGIFTTDHELIVRSWDAWLERATGIRSGDATGKRLADVIPDLEARGLLQFFRRSLDEGVIEILSPRFHRYLIACAPTRASRRFDRMQQKVTVSPLKENSVAIGLIVSVEDFTARLDDEHDDALLDIFDTEDWAARRQAASRMAREGSEGAVAGLIRVLRQQHRNMSVLNSALRVLTGSGLDVSSALVELLSDTDHDLRMYAALALGDLKDRRTVPDLTQLLRDPDVNVRFHAIEALAKIGAPEAAGDLLELAHSGDFFLAFPAIDALAALQDPRIAIRLVPLLNDDLVRISVIDALGRLGDDQTVAPLAELLATSGPHLVPAASALVSFHERYQKQYGEGGHIEDLVRRTLPAGATKIMLEALDSTTGEGLRALIKLLSWVDNREVAAALTRLLGSEDVRQEVIEALVRHGRDVTGGLLEQLSDENSEVRRAAIVALGRIGDPASVPALIRTLGEQQELSVPAAVALSRIGDSRAYSALIKLLGHRNASVRQAAMGGVNSLGDPRTEADVTRMILDTNPIVRESAVRIAGYFGYAACTRLVIDRTQDPDETVRRAAIESLPFIDNGLTLPILVRALREEVPRIRAAAAHALAYVDDPEALSALRGAMGDADAWVRYYAVRSLGQLTAADAVDVLAVAAQSDPATHVRIASAEALSAIGGEQAARVLRLLLDAEESDIVAAAAAGLGSIRHPDALPPLLEMSRSEDRARRLYAVRALGTNPEREVIRVLEWLAAKDADPEVCGTAIDALAAVGSGEAVNSLIRLTAQELLRERCIRVLAQLDTNKLDLLATGLAHPQKQVRCAVVEVLSRKKHPKASQLLAVALDDEDPSVREAGALALARLGSHSAERKLALLMSTDPDSAVRHAAQKALKR